MSRFGPSSTFLTSSTASSATSLAGLFHPAATSGIRSSGVFPLRAAVMSSSPTPALLAFSSPPTRRFPAEPVEPAPPGLSSTRGVRSARRGGAHPVVPAPLLSFCLLRVLLREPRELRASEVAPLTLDPRRPRPCLRWSSAC
jgi:hypothetical protein